MTELTPEQCGDLTEALLPEAAALAMAVREESRQEITDRLRGLTRHQLEALTVVLAAMVDPDRSLKDALSWIDFDEYGDPTTWKSTVKRTLRQAVPKPRLDRSHGIDEVAVQRALRGERVPLSSWERTRAIEVGILRGRGYDGVAEALGMKRDSVERSWFRIKERRIAAGLPVPTLRVDKIRDAS